MPRASDSAAVCWPNQGQWDVVEKRPGDGKSLKELQHVRFQLQVPVSLIWCDKTRCVRELLLERAGASCCAPLVPISCGYPHSDIWQTFS